MMPDFTKLWDKKYLFGPNPLDFSRSDHIFFWAALIFVVAGIAAKIFSLRQNSSGPKRFLFNRFYRLFLTMGILLLLWVGARFENIPRLSAHIAVLALFLIWLVWLVFLVKFFLRKYRSQQQAWQEEQTKQRYLSKK